MNSKGFYQRTPRGTYVGAIFASSFLYVNAYVYDFCNNRKLDIVLYSAQKHYLTISPMLLIKRNHIDLQC